jgi:hypothetical protein
MKKLALYVAPLLLAGLLVPATGTARPQAGDQTLTVLGSGANDRRFDTGSLNVGFEYGRFWSPTWQVGLRQGLGYTWIDGADNIWSGATRAFTGWHFVGDTAWVPQIGASLGFVYGDNVSNSLSAGLEAGFKYYVRENTFVGLLAEYQFLFESPGEIGDQFNDGAIFYNLSVGFHF